MAQSKTRVVGFGIFLTIWHVSEFQNRELVLLFLVKCFRIIQTRFCFLKFCVQVLCYVRVKRYFWAWISFYSRAVDDKRAFRDDRGNCCSNAPFLGTTRTATLVFETLSVPLAEQQAASEVGFHESSSCQFCARCLRFVTGGSFRRHIKFLFLRVQICSQEIF